MFSPSLSAYSVLPQTNTKRENREGLWQANNRSVWLMFINEDLSRCCVDAVAIYIQPVNYAELSDHGWRLQASKQAGNNKNSINVALCCVSSFSSSICCLFLLIPHALLSSAQSLNACLATDDDDECENNLLYYCC